MSQKCPKTKVSKKPFKQRSLETPQNSRKWQKMADPVALKMSLNVRNVRILIV